MALTVRGLVERMGDALRLTVMGSPEGLAREIPTAPVGAIDGLSLVDALVTVGLVKSKSDARRQIEQGGVYVNQQRETDANRVLGSADLLAGRNVVVRKGKKDYGLLRVAQS